MISQSANLLLTCHNKNMKYKKRTWCNTPRSLDITMLAWLGKKIGLSRLDDIRGELKRQKYVKRWQTPYRNKENGQWTGSKSSTQLTLKGCQHLSKQGILIYRPAWSTAKKHYNIESLPATRVTIPAARDKVPKTQGINPYIDPGFRRSLDLPEIPPFDPEAL